MPPKTNPGSAPVSGGQLYYETRGEGHPLVLIHAGIVDRRMWDREFDLLADRFRVIRYDVRGFGRSPGSMIPGTDAEDLHKLLKYLSIDQASIVGVSNGGRIAIDFAVEHPDEVATLIPVASGLSGFEGAGDPEETKASKSLETAMERAATLYKAKLVEEALEELVGIWATAQTAEGIARVKTMMRENLRAVFDEDVKAEPRGPHAASRLGTIQVNTLIIEGGNDHPAIHFVADAIARGIPRAERVTIPGADHLVNMSRPDEFEDEVRDFIE